MEYEHHLVKRCTCGNVMHVLEYQNAREWGLYATDRSFEKDLVRKLTCYLSRHMIGRRTRGAICLCGKYHRLSSFKVINPVEEVLGGYC